MNGRCGLPASVPVAFVSLAAVPVPAMLTPDMLMPDVLMSAALMSAALVASRNEQRDQKPALGISAVSADKRDRALEASGAGGMVVL